MMSEPTPTPRPTDPLAPIEWDPNDVVQLPAPLLARWSLLPAIEGAPPLATWDVTTDDGIIRLHGALEGQTDTLWDLCEHGPVEIHVQDIACAWREHEMPDQPGEMVAGPALTLIGPDATYSIGVSASEGVYRSLQRLAARIGPPPWLPAARLVAERVPTRNRRTRLALVYVGKLHGRA